MLASGRRCSRRRLRLLEKGGIVDADVRLLGELPEPQRGVQVQLPPLLLSAPPKIFLLQVQTNILLRLYYWFLLAPVIVHVHGFYLLVFFLLDPYLVLSYPLQLRGSPQWQRSTPQFSRTVYSHFPVLRSCPRLLVSSSALSSSSSSLASNMAI